MTNKKRTWFDYFLILFFIIILIVTLYPFLNVLAISLNDATDTLKNVNLVIPRIFTLANYKYVFEEGEIFFPFFYLYSKNSCRNFDQCCLHINAGLYIKSAGLCV